MASSRGKVAFVTGANGITGNAIIEHLIRQPASEWSQIIITSRRVPSQSLWQDARVRFISLDFLTSVEELIERMKPVCRKVTHAFFTSYVHSADFAKLRDGNVPMFQNFLVAIDTVAAKTLQRVSLQTGGKYFGPHLGPVEVPLNEEMPRYEDKGQNFYYPQEDYLHDLAAKRSWDWNVIRPNAIIGYAPQGNGMSMALTMAMYFLVCREEGKPPVFPGNKFFYNQCVEDVSYAPSIADMTVWAATCEDAKNEDFMHQNGDVFVWKQLWTKLGSYFDIDVPEFAEWEAKGDEQRQSNNFLMTEWHQDKKQVWEKVVSKYGGQVDAFDWGTWDFVDWAVGKAWLTISSVNKARKFGWMRHDDTYDTFVETFRAFENAGSLPFADAIRAEKKSNQQKKALAPHPYDAVASNGKPETNGVYTNSAKEGN